MYLKSLQKARLELLQENLLMRGGHPGSGRHPRGALPAPGTARGSPIQNRPGHHNASRALIKGIKRNLIMA